MISLRSAPVTHCYLISQFGAIRPIWTLISWIRSGNLGLDSVRLLVVSLLNRNKIFIEDRQLKYRLLHGLVLSLHIFRSIHSFCVCHSWIHSWTFVLSLLFEVLKQLNWLSFIDGRVRQTSVYLLGLSSHHTCLYAQVCVVCFGFDTNVEIIFRFECICLLQQLRCVFLFWLHQRESESFGEGCLHFSSHSLLTGDRTDT